MQATIKIINARFYSYIGVLKEEQKLGNQYIVNLSATYDASAAISSDDVEVAVSYADLYDVVREYMELPHNLLEYVAGGILQDILFRYKLVDVCEITIQKVLPPIEGIMDGASVTLVARRGDLVY